MKKFIIFFILLLSTKSYSEESTSFGLLSIIVFYESKPLTQENILVDGIDKVRTDNKGLIETTLSQGIHKITFKNPDYSKIIFSVKIVANKTTQAIVSIFPNSYDLDLETPPSELQTSSGNNDSLDNFGTISGKIIDEKNKEPISNVKIYVRGVSTDSVSDNNGKFYLKLKPGEYSLSIIHPEFSTQTLHKVNVEKNNKTVLNVELTPAALQLEDFVIIAPHLKGSVAAFIEIRRQSSKVVDVLGAEQMAKSGDSDAASALKRVTGLTLIGGKYVYVRGLGERYSSTLLNDANLPSPDPTRRVIPLDMFPTGILEGVMIQKSYSPNMPGEFGGGVIQLKTKKTPQKKFLNVSASMGYIPGDTLCEGYHYEGGKYDILGFDDGSRELPDIVKDATKNDKELKENNMVYTDGYSAEELEVFGEAMPRIYSRKQTTLMPPVSFSISQGNKYTLWGKDFSYLTSLLYGHDWSNESKTKVKYNLQSGDTYSVDKSFDYKATQKKIKLGSLIDVGLNLNKKHNINNTLLIIRRTVDNTQNYEGYRSDMDTQVRVTELKWEERMLLSNQLSGEHEIPFLNFININWRYTYSKATRKLPDYREYRYDLENGVWKFSVRNDGNQRIYSYLTDNNHDYAVDTDIKLPEIYSSNAKLKLGAAYVTKKRDSETRRFSFSDKRSVIDPNLTKKSLEDILNPENIKPDGFQIKESTRATDNYNASQKLKAFYGMVDLDFNKVVRLSGGMRYERSKQDISTFQLFDPSNSPITSYLETVDHLPAINATWHITKNLQFRGGYSRTLSRPDFKELSAAPYTDDERGDEVRGNEELVRAVIDNIDARIEWYISSNESTSLGLFYKRFNNPIEMIIEPGTEGIKSFENADHAKNYGVEFDLRKDFSFISNRLRNIILSTNLSYIYSRIKLSKDNTGIQTTNNRPLQGQSPYVINIQLEYDNPDKGTAATILYNTFGERITEVGTGGASDIKEQPFHQIDFIVSQDINKDLKVKLKINNILDPKAEFKQGNYVTQTKRKGRSINVSVSGKF